REVPADAADARYGSVYKGATPTIHHFNSSSSNSKIHLITIDAIEKLRYYIQGGPHNILLDNNFIEETEEVMYHWALSTSSKLHLCLCALNCDNL
ncbi:hypothetical protein ACJX0J_033145, partial [Zea mays]